MLCLTGPMNVSQPSHHFCGNRHEKRFFRYMTLYHCEQKRIQEDFKMAAEGRCWHGLKQMLQLYHASPFWCGDLSGVKVSLYDLVIPFPDVSIAHFQRGFAAVDASFKRHVRRVQADLLFLAYVKVLLASQFGSVEECRIHCGLHEQLRLSAQPCSIVWRDCLKAAVGGQGHLLLELVMPWVPAFQARPQLQVERLLVERLLVELQLGDRGHTVILQ